MKPIRMAIPEASLLDDIISSLGHNALVMTLGEVACAKGVMVPVKGLVIGNRDPRAPCLGLFGGVHGLERIGTQVVLSYLQTLSQYLRWDESTKALFQRVRLISIPLINPYGFWHNQRSNENHVDLMRNAPIDGDHSVARLVGGHRISKRLPWYRGALGAPMELECQWVEMFVRQWGFNSDFLLTLDCHSGFGYKDRLWYPYAKTREPFFHLPQMMRLKGLLDRSLPHHVYQIEPQSLAYCTHGDLWDYLYDCHLREHQGGQTFLPLALEMGSWIWVKKNPWQFFSRSGAFNPIVEHRHKRVLRRHLLLLDFLSRATANHELTLA